MNDKRCVLCKQGLDTEHPQSVYGRNPNTFRYSWMHIDCYNVAFEDLKDTPSNKIQYINRLDEFLDKD